MLRHRLIFGTLMAALFAGLAIGDGLLDGSLSGSTSDDKPVQATVLVPLLVLVIVFAQLELAKLAAARDVKVFVPVAIIGASLLATVSYVRQLIEIPLYAYSALVLSLVLMAVMTYQYARYRTSGVLVNCGVTCFSTVYLGILGGFCTSLRIEYGPLELLMFIFVVKAADIGAYTAGTLFGAHRFAPGISPGKTWEGMAGAVVAAATVAVLFAVCFDIMKPLLAVLFGVLLAFAGQLGDLMESMIKRDAERKDSSGNVPGFGGILDVIDSVLLAAPFAYLFLMLAAI
jgi:phosphatidate cytidylyltransferase